MKQINLTLHSKIYLDFFNRYTKKINIRILYLDINELISKIHEYARI